MKWENDRIIETVSPVSFKADVDEVDKMRRLAFLSDIKQTDFSRQCCFTYHF